VSAAGLLIARGQVAHRHAQELVAGVAEQGGGAGVGVLDPRRGRIGDVDGVGVEVEQEEQASSRMVLGPDLAYVAHAREGHRGAVRHHRGQADLDRQLGPVVPEQAEGHARPHRPVPGSGLVALPPAAVPRPVRSADQDLDGLADEPFGGIPRHRDQLAVRVADGPLGIDEQRAVGGVLDQVGDQRLGRPPGHAAVHRGQGHDHAVHRTPLVEPGAQVQVVPTAARGAVARDGEDHRHPQAARELGPDRAGDRRR
jgi:hypothetical protein